MVDKVKNKPKMVRSKLRVEYIGETSIYLSVFGFDTDDLVRIDICDIPFKVWVGREVHAKIDINCESIYDMIITDWELK